MSDHEKELPGLLQSAAGDRIAEAASEAARATAMRNLERLDLAAHEVCSDIHVAISDYIVDRLLDCAHGSLAVRGRLQDELSRLGLHRGVRK